MNDFGKATAVDFDVVVVGAGFAGLYLIHRLRELGFSVRAYEKGSDVGGTWYWNRYPGARCDVESMDYSYSFSEELQQEWEWSERYATQPEILRYIRHVAERFDLRRDIRFDTRVETAEYDQPSATWRVRTGAGEQVRSRFFVMASGCLSSTKKPEIAGLERFAGPTYHTGLWPHEGVDFSGKRVAVIGTGSSAIQAIPEIARQAAHLHVFQRTPNFSVPAHNRPLTVEEVRERKRSYPQYREQARHSYGGVPFPYNPQSALEVSAEERERRYRELWQRGGVFLQRAFGDLLTSKAANDTAVEFVHARIGEIVRDPRVAASLMPKSHPLGTKRICVDTDYYATYNRPNVTLVDLAGDPIVAITERGVRTLDNDFEFDALVFATGYDAMTGPLLAVDIRGIDGLSLHDKWSAGPRTYLGLATAGFPNLFMVTAPGSPSVLSNMIVSIEQHVEWISELIAMACAEGIRSVEAQAEAEDAWVETVNRIAAGTLMVQANSWYLGANVPGKPRVFMPFAGGVDAYRAICDEVAEEGYRGFELERVEIGEMRMERVVG
ncbi:Phenylacetone monooxygenase [compost metagenome]